MSVDLWVGNLHNVRMYIVKAIDTCMLEVYIFKIKIRFHVFLQFTWPNYELVHTTTKYIKGNESVYTYTYIYICKNTH